MTKKRKQVITFLTKKLGTTISTALRDTNLSDATIANRQVVGRTALKQS